MQQEKWNYLSEWMRIQNLIDNKIFDILKDVRGDKTLQTVDVNDRQNSKKKVNLVYDISKIDS